MMNEEFQVESLDEAIEIARAFAINKSLNESRAALFAASWYDAGNDFDASTPRQLREFLAWRFGIPAHACLQKANCALAS